MEIVVIGSAVNLDECRQKFGETHKYQLADNYSQIEENALNADALIFDFEIIALPSQIEVYHNFSGIVFLDVSKNSLQRIVNSIAKATIFGFCGFPTFLNREILEVSISTLSDLSILQDVCKKLNTKFTVVKDQIGLVTPRVICMIINEAYFAIQDKIASREDIDLAMKLGTNYPFGPFEWCRKIGIKNVYESLKATYESTKDDRYKVCELLKQEALLKRLSSQQDL